MNIEKAWTSLTPPGGRDMRYEACYDRIRQARDQEEDLPLGVWQHTPKKADWPKVAEECLDILAHHSKDLQVFFWLGEALIHHQGLQGLADALDGCVQFCQRYGTCMYPYCLEGDDEALDHMWHWADKTWSKAGHFLPVGDTSVRVFQWMHMNHVVNLSQRSSNPSGFIAKEMPHVSPTDIKKQVAQASPAFFEQVYALVPQMKAHIDTLQTLGQNPHIFSKTLKLITHIQDCVPCWKKLGPSLPSAPSIPSTMKESAATDTQNTVQHTPHSVQSSRPVSLDLTQACQWLSEIQAYLKELSQKS